MSKKKKDKKWKISKKFADKLFKSEKKKNKKKTREDLKEFMNLDDRQVCIADGGHYTQVPYTFNQHFEMNNEQCAAIDGDFIEDLLNILNEMLGGRVSSNELNVSCSIITISNKRIKFGCAIRNPKGVMISHCWLYLHLMEDDPILYVIRCGKSFINLMSGNETHGDGYYGKEYVIKFYEEVIDE